MYKPVRFISLGDRQTDDILDIDLQSGQHCSGARFGPCVSGMDHPMNVSTGQPTLKSGLPIGDLYTRGGLARLDELFLASIEELSPELHQRLWKARQDPSALADKARSELMIELAPHLEDFLGEEFGISR